MRQLILAITCALLAASWAFAANAQSTDEVDHAPYKWKSDLLNATSSSSARSPKEWMKVASEFEGRHEGVLGSTLSQACDLINIQRNGPRQLSMQEITLAEVCDAYIFGVIESEELQQLRGTKNFCWTGSKEKSLGNLVASWIKENRACKRAPAIFCVTAALANEYPCNG